MTNNVELVAPGKPMYAAFLNPAGKFMYDVLIHDNGDESGDCPSRVPVTPPRQGYNNWADARNLRGPPRRRSTPRRLRKAGLRYNQDAYALSSAIQGQNSAGKASCSQLLRLFERPGNAREDLL